MKIQTNNKSRSSRIFEAVANKSGFTIIEIMIVLVIASAIILIVFLAVPALQRNSRNNQRKNDAARVLAAAEEWRTTNSNQLPHCNDMSGRVEGVIPDCAIRTQIESIAGDLGYYENIWSVNNVEYPSFMVADNSLSENQDVINYVGDSVLVRSRTQCAEPSKLDNTGSGLVVLYSQETGNGMILVCRG